MKKIRVRKLDRSPKLVSGVKNWRWRRKKPLKITRTGYFFSSKSSWTWWNQWIWFYRMFFRYWKVMWQEKEPGRKERVRERIKSSYWSRSLHSYLRMYAKVARYMKHQSECLFSLYTSVIYNMEYGNETII